jgi:hypothetical protein
MIKPPTAMFAPTLAFKVMQRLVRHMPPQGNASDPIPAFPSATE